MTAVVEKGHLHRHRHPRHPRHLRRRLSLSHLDKLFLGPKAPHNIRSRVDCRKLATVTIVNTKQGVVRQTPGKKLRRRRRTSTTSRSGRPVGIRQW